MTMKAYIILIRSLFFILLLNLCVIEVHSQSDKYDLLKIDYDRLRKENKQDSALLIASEMNTWALKNETDTSLRYAVTLRYLGNIFSSKKIQIQPFFIITYH
jgi:hypothetical protein